MVASVSSSATAFLTPTLGGLHLRPSLEATRVITVPPFLPKDNDYPSLFHHIHIQSILSDAEASHCLGLAKDYAKKTGCWNAPDTSRHQTFSTCDFPVDECDEIQDYLDTQIRLEERISNILSSEYTIQPNEWTYLDLFCAQYQARDISGASESAVTTMDRLELHRDGSLLSFSLLLNPPSGFTGGGTCYDALKNVPTIPSVPELAPGGVICPIRAGDIVVHCGKLLHGAAVVESGHRIVLVGFLEVSERRQRPGVLRKACSDWGRMDVALKLYQRQLEHMSTTTTPISRGRKYRLLRNMGPNTRSSLRCRFNPSLSSVRDRADSDVQRQRRLHSEDKFLRSIMLP